ncbi:hypothetical protein [Onishia niordana]|uniref:hypothetical protein n=1 Tax=Onishia niordana TaxID=2508711 RepID=UPI00109FC8E3|nr:hypothetical protein [Halomonas niordiana]
MIDKVKPRLALSPRPELQIQQLWAHEQAEKQRYRSAAFHFLMLDPTTSRLLALLGTECEARLARLAPFTHDMDMTDIAHEQGHFSLVSLAHDDEPATVARRQFSQAIAAAKRALYVYESMCESSVTLSLQTFLNEGCTQKRAEHQLLLEHLEMLPLPASRPSSADK